MAHHEVIVVNDNDISDNIVQTSSHVQRHAHTDQALTGSGLAGHLSQRHIAPASTIQDGMATLSNDGNCTSFQSSYGHSTSPPDPHDQGHLNDLQYQHQLPLARALHQANVCQVTLDSIVKQLVQELIQLKQAIPGLVQSNHNLTCRLQQAETRLHTLSTDDGWKRNEAAHEAKLAEARLAATMLQHTQDELRDKLDETLRSVSNKEEALVARDETIKQLQTGEIHIDSTVARLLALNEAVQKAKLANEQSATAENVELRAKLLSSDRARQRLRNESDLFRTQLTSLAADRQYPSKRKQPRQRILGLKFEDAAVKKPFSQAMDITMLPIKQEPLPDAQTSDETLAADSGFTKKEV